MSPRSSKGRRSTALRMKVIQIRPAGPTIANVLERFLEDQKARLSSSTFSQYRSIVQLLQHSINSYGPNRLDPADTKLWERHFNAKGEAHREFCEIFGPEHILPSVGEFLSWFMVRKIMAGKDMMRAAGTVTKKLARWLGDEGLAGAEAVEDANERGSDAVRDLPVARELADHINRFAESTAPEPGDDDIEDHFEVMRVESGKLWLQGLADRRNLGPVPLPPALTRLCKVGWTISGVLGKVRARWLFLEAWNVYPR